MTVFAWILVALGVLVLVLTRSGCGARRASAG